MSILKFNKKSPFLKMDTEGFEYHKLGELYTKYGSRQTYRVRALYVNDSKYGLSPLAITDKFFVNLPNHLAEDVYDIISDDNIVEQINLGKIGFKIYEYTSKKYNRVAYSIEWIEF